MGNEVWLFPAAEAHTVCLFHPNRLVSGFRVTLYKCYCNPGLQIIRFVGNLNITRYSAKLQKHVRHIDCLPKEAVIQLLLVNHITKLVCNIISTGFNVFTNPLQKWPHGQCLHITDTFCINICESLDKIRKISISLPCQFCLWTIDY